MNTSQYLNRNIDVDGAYGSQCFDLAVKYMMDYWGLNFIPYMRISGGVRDMFEQTALVFGRYANQLERITNDPNNLDQIPQAGDVLFGLGGQYNAKYGHVMVVEEADSKGFWCIEQNGGNGDGQGADDATKRVYRDYLNCMGWLRLRNDVVMFNEPCVYTRVQFGEGISQILLRLNSPYYTEQWAWETVAEANGVPAYRFNQYNESLIADQIIKIPTRLVPTPEPAVPMYPQPIPPVEPAPVETPTKPEPVLEQPQQTPVVTVPVEVAKPAEQTKPVEKFDINKFLIGFGKVNADKATYAVAIIAVLTQFNEVLQLGVTNGDISRLGGLIALVYVIGGVIRESIKVNK